jgi:glycosyltransferase involved in cell wall biosynthesis
MKVWIVKESEPFPLSDSTGRIMRAGIIASMLATRKNEVTWWSSTYMHFEKRYYCQCESEFQITQNYRLRLLHSSHGYKKNISFKRILYAKNLEKEFKKAIKKQPLPDVIYCSWPLIGFAYQSVRFGIEHQIPVVIDIRDFWPDIFIQPFPSVLKCFVKFAIKVLLEKKVHWTLVNATAIVGVIPKTLEFVKVHGRQLKPIDHVVNLAYDNSPVATEKRKNSKKYWNSIGISNSKFIVSFIGTISNRIGDFDLIVEAASKCKDPDILFVFCGTGSYFDELSRKTKTFHNVILPGYKSKAELQVLMDLSSVGLLAYRNTEDFVDALPNKFGEYLSGGLVILTELRGLSRTLVEKYQCGFFYQNADSLLSSIEIIKNNQNLQKQMSLNALELFKQQFDSSKVYGDFCDFIEKLGNKDMEESPKF